MSSRMRVSMRVRFTYSVPGVTLFDAAPHYDLAGLGPRFKGFKFQLNATNLFDKT